jgi:insertion element IS1 protein InsB
VVGGRDAATFRRLYDKVKHLTECIFYTDDWDAFAKHLPPERHVIGKAPTITIEHDTSNTRHHLGRMTRRTKVVSKKPQMVYDSIKLWLALTTPALFQQYQVAFLSIFM